MHILTKLNLDNDLDLMLAHKRSMQVAEYGGIGLVHQTSFATAVSEVCRLMLEKGVQPYICLGFKKAQSGRNSLCAQIVDLSVPDLDTASPSLIYASRLVTTFSVAGDAITLLYEMPGTLRLSRELITQGQRMFEELPPVTPYEQAKQLNMQLQQMATRLSESEKRYKVLTDSLPMMMFTLNGQGQFVFANEGLARFAKVTRESMGELNWFAWMAQSGSSVADAALREKFTAGKPFSVETALRNASSGEKVWFLLSLTPIEDDLSGILEWSGFLVSIHAQKVVEETLRDNAELKQTQLALEKRQIELDVTIRNLNRSNEDLARFAYVASHDLQEPARKMIVFSEMARKKFHDVLPPDGANLLSRIQSASQRMVAVIRDLLDYSRLSVDQQMEKEMIDFSDIIAQVKDYLEHQITDSGASVRLETSQPVYGNRRLLVLLFQNLIGNSIKFVAEGTKPNVSLRLDVPDSEEMRLAGLDPQAGWTCIEVADNGIGFDEQFLDKIFQMFQRLHTQDQFQGTGIGLTICKRIVDLHQGRITARSTVNEGSVFSVYLPVN